MKKTYMIFAILVFASSAFAVEPIECPGPDFYDFGNGLVFSDFHTDKMTYKPGENVFISYTMTSHMKIPIVNGKVIIKIYKDYQIIDEFVSVDDVNLKPGESYKYESKWKVPNYLPSGEYEAKVYFVVNNKFNLAGINFLPTIYGTSDKFKIDNEKEDWIHFEDEKTYVNGKLYDFAAFSPLFFPGDEINITVAIRNDGQEKDSVLTVKTYRWDDLSENVIDTKTYNLHFNENEEKTIDYSININNPDAYLTVFDLKSGDEEIKLKIRLDIAGENGRFVYLGVDKFPIEEGDNITVFGCFAGTDYISAFNGTITLKVLDENGVLEQKTINAPIYTNPYGIKFSFITPRGSRKITVSGKLESNGKTSDTVDVTYDYSKFWGIERNAKISIPKVRFKPNEEIHYTITYSNEFGDPLKDYSILYLTDNSGRTITTNEFELDGKYEGTFSLDPGVYKIKLRIPKWGIKEETTFAVLPEGQQETREPNKMNIWIYVAFIIAILIIGLLIYKYSKRRGEKNENA